MATLTKASILRADDLKLKSVDVPEWGGSVMIRTMTAGDKGRFEQKMNNRTVDFSTVLAEYASIIICDESGDLLFTAKDIKELSEKSAASLQRVFDAGQEMNVMTRQDIEDLAGKS